MLLVFAFYGGKMNYESSFIKNLEPCAGIFSLIKNFSGINLNEAHRRLVSSFVKQRLSILEINLADYERLLYSDDEEFYLLIDTAAINETYFFREEIQFDFLNHFYLPKFDSGQIRIWSAACSSGEEAVSLYALCKSHSISAKILASDIDTFVLKILKDENYTEKSFKHDGQKYHHLIENCCRFDGKTYTLDDDAKKSIIPFCYNLVHGGKIPLSFGEFDIVFLRNLFIYFDEDLQRRILNNIAVSIKKGGLLFLSVNETASVFCNGSIPYKKEHYGDVYFLRRI